MSLYLPSGALCNEFCYRIDVRFENILREGIVFQEGPETFCLHGPEDVFQFGKVIFQHPL